jgi:hypothetical protein
MGAIQFSASVDDPHVAALLEALLKIPENRRMFAWARAGDWLKIANLPSSISYRRSHQSRLEVNGATVLASSGADTLDAPPLLPQESPTAHKSS